MAEERLHKMVDGVKVYLSEEEELEVRARWAAEEARIASKQAAKLAEAEAASVIQNKLRDSLGITDEELQLLLKSIVK